jgi:putative membrane protein
MFKRKILKQMFQVATFSMMFGAASFHAQSANSGAAATSSKPASGSADSGSTVSKKDQKIMREMAQSNIAEIEAGKIALTKSQNDKVKSFAQKMIDDHTKVQQDLQQVAQAKGVTLPTEPDAKHKAMAIELSGLSGDKFDRRYMAQGGLADHKKTHRLLERAQSKATDPDVKNLATKTQPVVEEHLSMAQQMQGNKATTDKTAATPADRARMAPSSSGGASSGAASSGSSTK